MADWRSEKATAKQLKYIAEMREMSDMKDLIDRQAAICWVKTECNPYGNPTIDFESGKKVIEHLKQMPSVQPERKTGKWIYCEDMCGVDGYRCDKCGFHVPWDYTHKFIDFIKEYHFCPNCGSDVRE